MEVEEAVPEAESLFSNSLSQSHHSTDDGAGSHEKVDANGGGILDHFISNFISHAPSSPKAGQGETNEVKETSSDDINKAFPSEKEESGDEARGGLVAKISNFFHPNEGEGKEAEEEKKEETVKEADEEDETLKAEGNAGAGFIDNIVSHLPSSLPGNGTPTPDEAAILIHSIIHD